MMSVESVRRELWLGEIPVCFSLDPDSLATIVDEPEPYCLMIPRNSYLPLHLSEVRSYFLQYVKLDQRENEFWCTDGDNLIKWHLPIGVTYDLLYGIKGQGQMWNIMMHFGDYPEQELLRCPSVDCIKSHFMSTIKEADSLKHASVLMNSMTKPEHAMLWNGLLSRSFDEFWTINRRLMDSSDSQPNQDTDFKCLPIRVYLPDRTYRQPHIPMLAEENSKSVTSVGDLFKSLDIALDSTSYVVSQGIEIPLEGGLCNLTHTLSYPDNFLYLCVANQIQLLT